jgi:hypothetical protein
VSIESALCTTLEKFEECLSIVHEHMDNWAISNDCSEVMVFDKAVAPGAFQASVCESGVVIYTTHPTNVRDGLALLVRQRTNAFSRLEAGPTRFYPPTSTILTLCEKLKQDPNSTLELYDALARTLSNADVENVLLLL